MHPQWQAAGFINVFYSSFIHNDILLTSDKHLLTLALSDYIFKLSVVTNATQRMCDIGVILLIHSLPYPFHSF